MRIYNTLTHRKQLFKTIVESKVCMYTCGPTVYNFAHIGNLRAYAVADLLKRVLIHDGYAVKHIMNITDVGHLVSDANLGEDKIRLTAQHEHKSVHDVAAFYTMEFMKDIKRLNLMVPDAMPKATENVKEMLEIIRVLNKKGYIYKIATGMYFDTSKFKNYGQLMNLNFDALNNYLIAGARVERAAGIKNTTDFAVWRFATGNEKEMVWDAEYGRGFPGWHIECSAMSMKYLGEHFDIHTGGIDHLPIHHTNEIAQSEAATRKKFVNYWVHNEFLLVDGKKMSKSLGNVYTLQSLIDKGHSITAFKYLILSAHYRSQLNFTFEALENAENTIKGIYAFMKRLSDLEYSNKDKKINKAFIARVARIRKAFLKQINDDLNTPLALSELHSLINETNRLKGRRMSKDDANLVLETLLDFDRILGLELEHHAKPKGTPKEVKELIAKRESLRKEKRFADADKIRERLKREYGIEVEDSDHGPLWHAAN
ncbi:MAG: cysteine--tRNA ligase [Candidatus Micrarchaeales archaeon]